MTIHDLVNLLVDYAQTDGSFEDEIKFCSILIPDNENAKEGEIKSITGIRNINGITSIEGSGSYNGAVLYSAIG